MLDDPLNLENVPIPVYPLPTKPFPVQPPPKIPTGFAPLIPLDRSHTKVRHWREANREIRGIAGGRWLAKTWVGDKESQFATYVAEEKVPATSRPPAQSSSTPLTSKAVSKLKASSKSASSSNSVNPSRATSAVPEHPGNPVTSAVRAPTKMRISQKAPSDVDSVAPA
jgi:Wiskott-Aldrich syndrome protein